MNNTNTLDTAAQWKDKGIEYLIDHGGAIVAAIFIFIVGIFVASWISKLVLRALEKKRLEPPLLMLISRIVKLIVLAFALFVALGTCGVNLLPLVAGIGVVGVGIGLAMQGVLSNVAAGLVIIFAKPFRVGEYIEIHGVQGQVANIELISTTLIHPDRSRVIVPNRKIVGEILHNYGTIRQLNLEVGVAYATDLNKAQAAVREVLNASARVLKDPVPLIGVTAMANSSIVLTVKPWTAVGDFGMARMELNQAIVEKFRADAISIPFPQREIRVLGKSDAA